MEYISKKDIKKLPRKRTSKKGDHGRVLVIGGSPDYVGAVALAGLAALRSGVDWVTIVAPEKVGWALNSVSFDLVVHKVSGEYFSTKHVSEILELEKKHTVVLIGNGISTKSKAFVKKYVQMSKKALVIDADAIKVLSLADVDYAIFTPHRKEFDLLIKNSKIKHKEDLRSNLKNNVILLKGETDQIITKSKTYFNNTGNAGMTKAGTGDVLAGLVAGFYAQYKDATMAAIAGAYYNGLIGDILLKKKKGYSFIATDMVEEILKIKDL